MGYNGFSSFFERNKMRQIAGKERRPGLHRRLGRTQIDRRSDYQKSGHLVRGLCISLQAMRPGLGLITLARLCADAL